MDGRRLLLLCFVLSTALTTRKLAVAAAASGSKVVTSLPGFHGRLPFHLETGYVEVDEDSGSELFYYFVESEAGGEDAPFLLWLSGGDHCSVLSGLALEIGPFQFDPEPQKGTIPRLKINPYSWTKVANILFVDAPVGAGFSFARQPEGYHVGEVSTSSQIHELLFKGYLVGNPVTGEIIDESSKVVYAHGVGIIPDQLYETILGHCHGEDYRNPTNAQCAQSMATFYSLRSEVMTAQILLDNCYLASTGPGTKTDKSASPSRKILSEEAVIATEKRVKNPPPFVPPSCYSYTAYLSYFWANDERTRDALGIKDGTVEEWVRCHSGDLPYAVDIGSSIKYHRNVTVNGYRALVYSGDHDAIIPHRGTQAWVRSLGFPIVDEWRAWHVGGQSAGFTISYSNNMTFATVKGGGHTAPQYEPERCYAMFRRWILDQPL